MISTKHIIYAVYLTLLIISKPILETQNFRKTNVLKTDISNIRTKETLKYLVRYFRT